jgi:uncharacterized membrane protein YphA (DoxX/SURF4 family)
VDRNKAIRFTTTAVLWLLTALLGVGFVILGIGKFSPPWPEMFAGWGFPQRFVYVVGAVEVVAGLLLLIPKTALPAAAALGVVMVGATLTHLVHGERNWTFTVIVLGVLSGVAVARCRRRHHPPSSPGSG